MSFNAERVANLNRDRLSSAHLKPELVKRVWALIAAAKNDGYTLIVTQGFRSIAEQNALYAQGRTKPGKIVTNARGGQSNHNHGEAVDFAFVIDGEITWDVSVYQNVGVWARTVGLKWGGDWKRFKDFPHVEI